jgi:hypothetical protein
MMMTLNEMQRIYETYGGEYSWGLERKPDGETLAVLD